ncbi:hypothetical protein GLOIN_2v1770345 [Rhizophagus irregularis DAOM 181602=DAOM 197198]|uniref:Uncharacterized protein n=2 Tax=Rhizophagus irregularis TaxID=588596 RepID=U9SLR5_RHIID|nr:hypothetical protein GLOIN_2v1770345 [Rhizophagus irregularis DAOM 181602=DAOM 197198]POG75295.1 hypothetical protein GLOIN_2v1770345 [Rhizophagus irregularis DAOM 181602=DAOM 197198]|eukprot:XP_025182161.1 hypothetical protein GLOIN_2v1770345 [Rhizophagus irregularis DAOM 181602=DAOM 197198]
MTFFTRMNDTFHERMDKIRKFAFRTNTKKVADRHILTSRCLNTLITDFEYVKDDLGDTSDDTKIIERHPKKHRARYTHYHNYGDLIPLTKKLCIFDFRETKEDDFLPANIDLIFKFST